MGPSLGVKSEEKNSLNQIRFSWSNNLTIDPECLLCVL